MDTSRQDGRVVSQDGTDHQQTVIRIFTGNYSLLCEGNFRYDFLMSSCVLNRIRGGISHFALRVVTSFFCPKTSYFSLPK